MSGGLAPVGKSPDQVYKATYQKVIERNKAYYSVSASFSAFEDVLDLPSFAWKPRIH